MPKSKKPRHKQRIHWIPRVPWMDQSKVAVVKDLFRDVELYAQLTLPNGQCRFREANAMREALNVGAALFVLDNKLLDQDWAREAEPVILMGQAAFHTWFKRGKDKHGDKDESVRFVATGDELNAIRAAFSTIGELIQTRLDEAPMRVCDMYQAVEDCSRRDNFGQDHWVSEEDLIAKVKEIIARTGSEKTVALLEGVNG